MLYTFYSAYVDLYPGKEEKLIEFAEKLTPDDGESGSMGERSCSYCK